MVCFLKAYVNLKVNIPFSNHVFVLVSLNGLAYHYILLINTDL